MLEIKLRQKDGVIIMDLSGRIDVNSANLVEVVGQCLRDGYTDILCNLEEIEGIDYMGISVVVIAYKEVANSQGRMKFLNIPAHLRGVFAVSGMDRVIEICATEDLAIGSFKEDKAIENIKKMQLRRRFKRLPIDLKVELKSKSSSSPNCLKVDMLNLSAVGAFIFGCDNFRLGDEVILKMKLAPKSKELLIEATVVWVPDKEVQPHEYPGFGVEFRNISPGVQRELIEFIERNLSFSSPD
ncbi:MAG: PilZ domain-containing protein [Candidatus Omnitrophica bacterium]|jgi:anti-anti-sigma factor|nr:PilZ domain-containing protein [Candidatus Omnitrophota bacterium]